MGADNKRNEFFGAVMYHTIGWLFKARSAYMQAVLLGPSQAITGLTRTGLVHLTTFIDVIEQLTKY